MPRFFEIEKCSAEDVRIYHVRGLRLYDEPEERHNGPVIELVGSLPGVELATFKDCHTFVVRRSLDAAWPETEARIVGLLEGVAACSDGVGSYEEGAEVGVAVLRSTKRRVL